MALWPPKGLVETTKASPVSENAKNRGYERFRTSGESAFMATKGQKRERKVAPVILVRRRVEPHLHDCSKSKNTNRKEGNPMTEKVEK